MSPVLPTPAERARKNHSVILHGLSRVGQVAAATELRVSESTISRMKDGELERFSALLAACGLKVVPQEFRCAKPEIIEAALVFARAAMERVGSDSSLVWDD